MLNIVYALLSKLGLNKASSKYILLLVLPRKERREQVRSTHPSELFRLFLSEIYNLALAMIE
jgi:hypothetical protein